ncbi:phosphatidic acid phosphatase type 2/haloperoxidase [Pseudomassariella vexata]|uniref:Phosphatidic acid phosphatase type 2/haloperoxidase n=1 Tax=Pseudomassariella vexata TaxID=1141098 RepID=A0A1Y2EKR9_9PEZI|nr:phosphatidic acid phosphatase type 2/haloperoxidase [Pseudomassariella vexata]ORY72142.1 phosphatidic acid phosphatase type 2/haloperoxidase [Pseudomassariella vexata]
MGLFNKRKEPNNATATSGGAVSPKQRSVAQPYSMSTKPSFGQWLKLTWLDILTMAIFGAIGLGVYMAHPAPNRSFAVTFSDREVVYPEFAYPLRKEIVPIWAAALLAALVPIVVILFMQIRIRSFWDVNNGIIGLLYSLIGAAVFQVFVKWLIGGLRPHFLDVCKPDISLATSQAARKGYNAAGFNSIYFTREICTGDINEIDDSLESMPSGHTTAAFAGFVYLYLYLNAKMKVFANYHPAMWKLIALYAPILGAVLIGGALTIDEYHNWYDVFAGAAIGTVFAFSAYRMVYCAIWDFRFNHIPLNRGQPALFNDGMELSHAVWTRKVGWGVDHGMGGKHGHGHGHSGAGNGYDTGYGAGPGTGVPRRPVGSNGADHMV